MNFKWYRVMQRCFHVIIVLVSTIDIMILTWLGISFAVATAVGEAAPIALDKGVEVAAMLWLFGHAPSFILNRIVSI